MRSARVGDLALAAVTMLRITSSNGSPPRALSCLLPVLLRRCGRPFSPGAPHFAGDGPIMGSPGGGSLSFRGSAIWTVCMPCVVRDIHHILVQMVLIFDMFRLADQQLGSRFMIGKTQDRHVHILEQNINIRPWRNMVPPGDKTGRQRAW